MYKSWDHVQKGSSGKVGGWLILAIYLDNLKRKNLISLTPLEVALKALIFALKDSAEAFVDLLIKKLRDQAEKLGDGLF